MRLVSASADVQLLSRPDDVPAYYLLFPETRLVGCRGNLQGARRNDQDARRASK
jgi:hypothetical protein